LSATFISSAADAVAADTARTTVLAIDGRLASVPFDDLTRHVLRVIVETRIQPHPRRTGDKTATRRPPGQLTTAPTSSSTRRLSV